MANERSSIRIGPFHLGSGGPNQALASAESFSIPSSGQLTVQCVVYDSTGGKTAAPTDAPAGTFQLWISGDDKEPFTRVTEADGAEGLGRFSLTGNNVLLNALVNFENVPGVRAKLLFVRTAGGAAGANARCQFLISRG